jgi:hypothetical protein
MSARIILVDPLLAAKPLPAKPKGDSAPAEQTWMAASGGLLLLLLAVGVVAKLQLDKLAKKLKMEEFKNRELQKKYKLAVDTITKMEKNPDLVHSREFNLDYLRMRMADETFHFAIVNQIKVKVKDKISLALRPTNETRGVGRQVEERFDLEYETGEGAKSTKGVLFRIEVKLTKLPTQPTSVTIGQIIDCIETYLSTAQDDHSWQPTIQGRVAYIHWDQKAKPTPLLVLEQSNEGVNVTFATKRQRGPASAGEQTDMAEEPAPPQTAKSSSPAGKRDSKTSGRSGKTGGSESKTSGRTGKTGGSDPKSGRTGKTGGR